MQSKLSLFFILLVGCTAAPQSEPVDIAAPSENKAVADSSSGQIQNNEWEEHGGFRLRKNLAFQSQLEGKTATRWFEATDGSAFGGTTKLVLKTQNDIDIFSNVKPSSGNGGFKEISDSGKFTVYEDTRGQLFMRFLMKNSGEGFVQLQFKEGRLWLTGPGGTEIFELKNTAVSNGN